MWRREQHGRIEQRVIRPKLWRIPRNMTRAAIVHAITSAAATVGVIRVAVNIGTGRPSVWAVWAELSR